MTQPFLSIRGIEKAHGSVVAVQDVSLDIAEGEFVSFLGPSGSGKSTMLYAIAGFLEPTKGDVLLRGKSLLPSPSNKRNIGMVFQRYTLFPYLSAADNVAFPLRVRRRSEAEIDAKVAAMLKPVRLERMADRMPAQMPGGQQRRVALAASRTDPAAAGTMVAAGPPRPRRPVPADARFQGPGPKWRLVAEVAGRDPPRRTAR